VVSRACNEPTSFDHRLRLAARGHLTYPWFAMTELVTRLISQANLSEDQAKKVAEVVRGFLADKLPEPLRGPVEGALTGDNVGNALDQAKGMLGKLF
jgi:hypothetical protein